ncbi:MAG: DNA polymerase I [Clostridia bacterium]|nr:DNA polymerase I [Clostridia bacterium]
METNSLLLIDGNSLINRAYFALPTLTAKDGTPSNAVYGFANILVKAILDYRPKYIAVAFDMRAPTFRHKMYDGYKATRKGMPDDLAVQMPVLKNMLDVMGIKHIGKEGIEADDVIGTLAKNHHVPTLILTGDRDSFQLIDESTSVLFTKRGISEVDIMTPTTLVEFMGLTPSQIIDYKALAGDNSDNIPGVPGIGDKRATDLLTKYGTAENVFAHADEIGGKLADKIKEGKALSDISKALATIKTDCDVDVPLSEMTYEFPFSGEVFACFEQLSFKSLLRRTELFSATTKTEEPIVEEKKIEFSEITLQSTGELLTAIEGATELAIDFGRNARFCANGVTQYALAIKETLFDVCPTDAEIVSAIKPILENDKVKKYVYDAKTVIKYLDRFGVSLNSYDDVALMTYLVKGSSKLPSAESYADMRGCEKTHSSCAIFSGAKDMKKGLADLKMTDLYEKVELPLVEVLYRMEKQGFHIDRKKLAELKTKFNADEKEVADNIFLMAGKQFNINSPMQLAKVLFDDIGLPYPKRFGTTSRGWKSTSAEVLAHIANEHPIVPEISHYRYIAKLNSTYLDGFAKVADVNGRIHTEFNQMQTTTGRLSSSEPNLQNIPVREDEGKVLRSLFTASEGNVLVSADYSQIELRVMAHLSGDENLIKAFVDGKDIHTSVAQELFATDKPTPAERRIAKTVNFGLIYGMSAFGLSERLGISPKQAKEYIEKYFAQYPKVKTYLENIVARAKKTGYAESLLGRRRTIPELISGKANQRSFGERAAMNMPLQSTAADIIKIAMLKVDEALKNKKSKLILQVHDELIIDTHPSELEMVKSILKTEMESAIALKVPLTVEVASGNDWLACK